MQKIIAWWILQGQLQNLSDAGPYIKNDPKIVIAILKKITANYEAEIEVKHV